MSQGTSRPFKLIAEALSEAMVTGGKSSNLKFAGITLDYFDSVLSGLGSGVEKEELLLGQGTESGPDVLLVGFSQAIVWFVP